MENKCVSERVVVLGEATVFALSRRGLTGPRPELKLANLVVFGVLDAVLDSTFALLTVDNAVLYFNIGLIIGVFVGGVSTVTDEISQPAPFVGAWVMVLWPFVVLLFALSVVLATVLLVRDGFTALTRMVRLEADP